MIKKFFAFLVTLFFLACLVGAGTLYWLIAIEPGSEIEPRSIESILGKESPVFYNDNMTQLGVFFDKSHRQYVTFSDIPSDFVNALVAAEDNKFFSHFGFDVVGIARAAMKNIQAGRVVQGGSTLTQQTAKNLFKRSERSFKAKLKELLYALRLEYHYPKEKIFEFYANQFYVSGNGHGLGVAARYYFDKEPQDLNLVECAFIAGSVKRPNYYNPFIKKSEEAVSLAKERSRIRLKYVLDKMLELEMIGFSAYREALASNIDFNQGKVGYSLDYVMEMVKDAVSSTEVTEALARHGVDNVAISGIRIVTTVDKRIQEKTLYALRHDLSRIDVMLTGYERDEVQKGYADIDYNGDSRLEENGFLFGTVESFSEHGKEFSYTVDFGRKRGSGILDRKGFRRLAEARVKWQENLWTEAQDKDVRNLADQLQLGDRVWVSVRGKDDMGNVLLELEKYPRVQGGALVMKDGSITAVVGGTENRFYNRAVYAKRTMGSSFKPFVFAAALQLGWNSSDLLKNSRDVFEFHNQPYFPRPDHKSPFEEVSMSWAGVKSENLASVWLLVHLCEHLSPVQFREVAEYLGLTQKVVDGENEPYRTYRTRIRDRFGIVVNRKNLRSAAFRAAVRNSEADFMFEDMVADYSFFKTLHYGLNFSRYMEQVNSELMAGEKVSNSERKELLLRRKILSMHYLRLEELRKGLGAYRSGIEDPLGVFQADLLEDSEGAALYYNRLSGEYAYQPLQSAEPYMTLVDRSALQELLFGLNFREKEQFWKSVRLHDKVSVAGFDLLTLQVDREYKRLQRLQPYSFEVLSNMEDFRIYVGLRYLIALAREMGVKSRMKPVLSFPLGSNVVSLLEATRMYEAMVTGSLTTVRKSTLDEEGDSLLILDRIESEDGRLLYRPEKTKKSVLAQKSRLALGHILESTVKFGTGRKADKQVKLQEADSEENEINSLDVSIPLLGKTGTANRYTNASFYGYLPGLREDDSLTVREGYAVGVYVGYDDNDPMRKGSIRITGSAGALPTWIDVVNELVAARGYSSQLDPVDLTFNGLQIKRQEAGQLNLASDKDNGGALARPATVVNGVNRYTPSILTFGTRSGGGGFNPERNFEPFWKSGDSPLQ